MKKIVFAFAMFAYACMSAEDSSVSWWYTPNDNDWGETFVDLYDAKQLPIGKIGVNSKSTPQSVYDDIYAKVVEKKTAASAYEQACRALAQAIYNKWYNEKQDKKIETLAQSLDVCIGVTDIETKDSNGNVIYESKRNAAYDAMKNSIIQGRSSRNGAKQDNSDHPIVYTANGGFDSTMFAKNPENPADGQSFNWALKGYYGQGGGYGNYWNFPTAATHLRNFTLQYAEQSQNRGYTLSFVEDFGENPECFDSDVPDNFKRLILKGWYDNAYTMNVNLSDLLTNKLQSVSDERAKCNILVRYDTTQGGGVGNQSLKYLPLGGVLSGMSTPVDDESIANWQENQQSEKKLEIKGFHSNIPEEATDGAKLPYADNTSSESGLKWGDLMTFMGSVFKKSSKNGKITINGVDENDENISILAVKGGQQGQSVVSLGGDGMSVDGGFSVDGQFQPKFQMHNFNSAPLPYGVQSGRNFADVLTNTDSVANMFVPVRAGTGGNIGLGYVPLGKVTGIPKANCDNKTINVTNDVLQIMGAKEAPKGTVLVMKDNHCSAWENIQTTALKPYPISESESKLPIQFSNNLDGGSFIGLRGWINTSGQAASADTLYGTKSGTPKSLKIDGKYGLGIKEAGAQGDHIALANYPTDGTCKIPYMKAINEELAWTAAPTGATAGNKKYLCTDGTTISWGTGGGSGGRAFKVFGTDGTSAVAGYGGVTNNITFASLSDSNVKVSVGGDGNGNITISLGVYYNTNENPQ